MKCIFCKEEISEDKRSREHIIPKFLGGKKVIHNICKDCNNKLGEDFESKLGNNELFNFICAFYRVKSRKATKFKKLRQCKKFCGMMNFYPPKFL